MVEHEMLVSCLASFRRGHCAAKSGARKLSCESSARPSGGIAVVVARLLPGSCADKAREISPNVLPDGSRPSRDRLAGLRAIAGELLASGKNLVKTRGKASTL